VSLYDFYTSWTLDLSLSICSCKFGFPNSSSRNHLSYFFGTFWYVCKHQSFSHSYQALLGSKLSRLPKVCCCGVSFLAAHGHVRTGSLARHGDGATYRFNSPCRSWATESGTLGFPKSIWMCPSFIVCTMAGSVLHFSEFAKRIGVLSFWTTTESPFSFYPQVQALSRGHFRFYNANQCSNRRNTVYSRHKDESYVTQPCIGHTFHSDLHWPRLISHSTLSSTLTDRGILGSLGSTVLYGILLQQAPRHTYCVDAQESTAFWMEHVLHSMCAGSISSLYTPTSERK
jgi:hypothetical protein